MKNNGRSFEGEEGLNGVVERAISSEIGNIGALPRKVADRLREIYRDFIPVYVEMIRMKENKPKHWQPTEIAIDPEMVEDMRHFFSDYQNLTRRFKAIRRQVKYLLTLDREAEPHRYKTCVEKIVSGNETVSFMYSIVDP